MPVMARCELPTLPREEDVKEGESLAGKYRAERVMGAGEMGGVVQVTHVGARPVQQRSTRSVVRPRRLWASLS